MQHIYNVNPHMKYLLCFSASVISSVSVCLWVLLGFVHEMGTSSSSSSSKPVVVVVVVVVDLVLLLLLVPLLYVAVVVVLFVLFASPAE